jgi:hypothetical protein
MNAVFPMGREEKGYSPVRILLLMGVSGSGKTMIGRRRAKELDWPFFEGDAFHSRRNVAKMSRGESLNDHDRNPWARRPRVPASGMRGCGRFSVRRDGLQGGRAGRTSRQEDR